MPDDEKPRLVLRFRFTDDPERDYTIDVSNLKRKEQVALEDHFGQPIFDLDRDGWLTRSARGMVFLGFLARRREDPDFTLEDAYEYEAGEVEQVKDTGSSAGDDEGDEKDKKRPTKPRTPKKSGSRSSGSTSE